MSIGIWQVILILLIVLIIFGAGKLPRVMGDVAKGVKNFKSGLKEEDEDTKKIDAEEGRTIHQTVNKDETAKSS
ncbi:twin-arginine translocase TatA/TatE family subunit [Arenibaculum sp.]|jgi:sec-independent protein translocase protein TatA|uniref:twin-arginine translocase TatA/TatE family subunit n=1 Tax=Arenibaculum sp. TaxID=2865862 RepID=UPI002E1498F9|nr:twin-arginine translocase TatA/TatE family subunit [Arenibaculum sp.]